ncbi:MAG: alpha/beta hydrolase [Verrucomicrobiae bacterium]|nr:alpha/beta hydrolase [Verrucomicrobiae bacterium]
MPLESVIEKPARALAMGLVDRNRQLLERASRHPYKIANSNGAELAAYVFIPEDWKPTDRRTCIVFFHSSQWDHGNITQFAPQAMFFASRGVVCILAEYRMGASDGMAPLQAMADARSAIRWARLNSAHLGLDESKIVASGGACGAHAAACAAMCDSDFDDPHDHSETSCVPDALVLFSPVLDISKKGVGLSAFADNARAKKANPLNAIRPGLPPMLLFHGGADSLVPISGAKKFSKKMKRKKNRCELMEFGGASHSFFNLNVNEELYYATVDAADAFLVSLGFLAAQPDTET